MRISDWRSDVCSSDLIAKFETASADDWGLWREANDYADANHWIDPAQWMTNDELIDFAISRDEPHALIAVALSWMREGAERSEEHRVGEVCVSTCSTWWSRTHY